jgi:hypothetical protein
MVLAIALPAARVDRTIASTIHRLILKSYGQGVGVLCPLGVGQGFCVGVTVDVPVDVGDGPAVADGVAVATTSVKNAARSTETVQGGTPAGP